MDLNRDTDRMFAYHEATKHSPESIRRSRFRLDWDNMPDPFRRYDGVPLVDLPAHPPPPEVPTLDVLAGRRGDATHAGGAEFLSRLLDYSAAISARKRVPSTGYHYSLRVNPSSGNLHPTEFHFATRGLAGWEDGLYHYRVATHQAEQRVRGDWVARLVDSPVPVVFVLATIAWREAWKYRDRAYRYCLLDLGHAWESLALAALALNCDSQVIGHFADDAVAEACGLRDEWPMLLITVEGEGLALEARGAPPSQWLGGIPNVLSPQEVEYPLIDGIQFSCRVAEPGRPWNGWRPVPTQVSGGRPFGRVVRRRRSALDYIGGDRTISLDQLQTLLEVARFEDGFVRLYVFAHRVRDLEPGLYDGGLRRLRAGDVRLTAAALSLGQDLAGNSCVTFSMIADLERAAHEFGNRGYRYAHFEAGAIGQRLYLASEAMGFQATGIGAFYDDEVHACLGVEHVIYHFACGFAVKDARLES